MNPNRSSHCKTDQIMRNTFTFPNQPTEEKEKEMQSLFWAVGLLETHHPSKHQAERVSGNKAKLSPWGWGKQVGQMLGRASPTSKSITDRKVWDSAALSHCMREIARQISIPDSCREVPGTLPKSTLGMGVGSFAPGGDSAGCLEQLWESTRSLNVCIVLCYYFRNRNSSRNTPAHFSIFLNVLSAVCNIP